MKHDCGESVDRRIWKPDDRPRRLEGHRVIWIEGGAGIYQIDFENYRFQGERILFLGPGQFFRVVHGELHAAELDLPAGMLTDDSPLAAATRVLFTHVIAVGAVTPVPLLLRRIPEDGLRTWLVDAARTWGMQKPLHPHIGRRATRHVFDLRQAIEADFRERKPVRSFVKDIPLTARSVNRITTAYLDRTVGDLVRARRLLEAKRELVFTERSVGEIARALDYPDPAYFSRAFRRETGATPTSFRRDARRDGIDPFVQDLLGLVDRHFRRHHTVSFYASRFAMTPKAFSTKVRRLTGRSAGRLIRERTVAEARKLLTSTDLPVQEIAFALGFEDPYHFSRFYRRETGRAPSIARHEERSI